MFKNMRKPLAGLMCACVLVSSAATFASAAEGDVAPESKGTLSIPVTKIITGRDWVENDKYEFTLSGIGEVEGVVLPEETKLEINSKTANHTGKFADIEFTGEVESALFRVAEKDGASWDVKADSKLDDKGAVQVTYEVGKYDEESKKFTKDASMPTILSIDMGKQAEDDTSARVMWLGSMTMTERDFVTDDVFMLDIKSTDADAPLPTGEDMYLALAEKNMAYVAVGPIAYDTVGEYKYTIKQNAEDKTTEFDDHTETVTYDRTEYEVTVKVTEDEEGVKSATVEYLNKTTNKKSDLMAFNNMFASSTKDPGETEKPGDENKPGEDDNKPGDDENKPGDEDKNLTDEQKLELIKPLLDGADVALNAAWIDSVSAVLTENGLMNDTMAGLLETAKGDKATDADRQAVRENLEAMYKALGGKLDEKPGDEDNKPGDDEKELIATKMAIKAEASLFGREWQDNDKFSFALAGEDDPTKRAIQEGDIVMPETLTVDVTKDTPDHIVSFGDIEFKTESPAEGYVFSVSQVSEDANGVTASTKSYDLVVNVKANEKNELVATATVFGGLFTDGITLSFENMYTAKALTGTIGGSVAMEGRKFLNNETLSFVLEDTVNKDAEKKVINVVPGKDATNGDFEFPAIDFMAAGEYNYKVYQNVPDDAAKMEGVTYDASVYSVKILITDDLVGNLVGSIEMKDATGKQVEKMTFTNKYKDPKAGTTDKKDNNKTTTSGKKTEKVTPSTGVESNTTLWVVLSCIGVVAIGGGVTLYVMYRKRQEEEDASLDVED